MSAKYFFETTDNEANYVTFDIDRVVGISINSGHTIVTIDAGADTLYQPVACQPEQIMKAIRSYSVRP